MERHNDVGLAAVNVTAIATGMSRNIDLADSSAVSTIGASNFLGLQFYPDENLNWVASHDGPAKQQRQMCGNVAGP